RRWTEIADLNPHLADPDFLQPGQTLRLPAPPATPAPDDGTSEERTYVVQAGDTLSQVAADTLGDAERYPDIAAASSTTVQADGDRLTDPDHIEPGWSLTIPVGATPVSDRADDPPPEVSGGAPSSTRTSEKFDGERSAPALETIGEAADADVAGPTTSPSSATTARRPGQDARGAEEGRKAAAGDVAADDAASQTLAWFLPGLASGDAVLAVGLNPAVTRGCARQERLR